MEERLGSTPLLEEQRAEDMEPVEEYEDPVLALAGLRIDIERRLRSLATSRGLDAEGLNISQLLSLLSMNNVISEAEYGALSDLVNLLNRAVHGAEVSTSTVDQTLELGERVLAGINDRSQQFEVVSVIRRFRGQTAPGRLFGAQGQMTLPTFTDIQTEVQLPMSFWLKTDIIARANGTEWVIEVKTGKRFDPSDLQGLETYASDKSCTIWVVVLSDVREEDKQELARRGILITGLHEWQELKRLVASPGTAGGQA
jgi:hypothetical protein